jgi:2-methylcitrate dehydratase PrpD
MAMILHRLAEYTCELHDRDLSADVLHAARRALVDWMAATIPGGVRPPATLFATALSSELGVGAAMLVPSGVRAGARTAALINGCAAHTIEFDDIYRDALYHPGAPTIAAALAAAQSRHATGQLFLRSVIAGYELSTRIGVVVNPTHYNFWHTTGTVGTFGAAAAAATVFHLDAGRCAHALATAGTLAAGLQQAFRSTSMSKPLHSGHAAETGLLAALGAERGVTGAPDILEGARGFGAAMSNNPDFARALDDVTTFNIRNMTFKNHGACGHTFAAIDAVRVLRETPGLAVADVERIDIATYAKALEVAGNPDPHSAFEAQFSLPYCVATALVTGSARMEAFTEKQLNDTNVRALMTRIHLSVDPHADAVYPNQRAATVTLRTRSGRVLSEHAPTRKGDPDNPLSDEELSDKFVELVAPVTGTPPARALLAVLWRIDTLDDLATLRLPPIVSGVPETVARAGGGS